MNNMVSVFKEYVIKPTEQQLQQSVERLKNDEGLKQKIRELANVSKDYKRLRDVLKSDISLDKEYREKWLMKRDKLNKKRVAMYYDLKAEGFENWWIESVVDNEVEILDRLLDDVRKRAYLNAFGKEDIDDIDINDKRWELVGQQTKQAIDNYIKGNL